MQEHAARWGTSTSIRTMRWVAERRVPLLCGRLEPMTKLPPSWVVSMARIYTPSGGRAIMVIGHYRGSTTPAPSSDNNGNRGTRPPPRGKGSRARQWSIRPTRPSGWTRLPAWVGRAGLRLFAKKTSRTPSAPSLVNIGIGIYLPIYIYIYIYIYISACVCVCVCVCA